MNNERIDLKVLALSGMLLSYLFAGCEWDPGRPDAGLTTVSPQVRGQKSEPGRLVDGVAMDQSLPPLVPAAAPDTTAGPPGPSDGLDGSPEPVVEFAFPHVDPEPVDHLSLAREKLGEKDEIGALLELQKAIYDDPQHYEAAMLLGRTAKKADRRELAVDAFVLASQIEPETDDPWLQLSRLALDQKDLDRSEQLARTALRLNPKRALSHNVIGRIWLNRSHWQRAIRHFQKAVALDPDNKYYRNNLGYAYLLKKDFTRAVEILSPLAGEEQVPAYMFNNLGLAYEGAGRLPESIAFFKRALEKRPRYVNARVNLDRLTEVASRAAQMPKGAGEEVKGGGERVEEPAVDEVPEEEDLLIPDSEEL